MDNLVQRSEYIEFLRRHRDKQVIKVVSGVRRSGKSTLFKLFQAELIAEGTENAQIIMINFEDLAFQQLHDYMTLYQYLVDRIHPTKKTYIFLDEIQMVNQFETVVDSLLLKDNVDLYITGSNAYFLSSELATLLSSLCTAQYAAVII